MSQPDEQTQDDYHVDFPIAICRKLRRCHVRKREKLHLSFSLLVRMVEVLNRSTISVCPKSGLRVFLSKPSIISLCSNFDYACWAFQSVTEVANVSVLPYSLCQRVRDRLFLKKQVTIVWTSACIIEYIRCDVFSMVVGPPCVSHQSSLCCRP